MLLARMGQRVLPVGKASFASDTISTHLGHAPGVAALAWWGPLGQLTATGCPPIREYSFDFGPFMSPEPRYPAAGTSASPTGRAGRYRTRSS